MPHPVPELQEILALEAKLRPDLYDSYPIDCKDHIFLPDGLGAKIEAELSNDVIYIKK